MAQQTEHCAPCTVLFTNEAGKHKRCAFLEVALADASAD